MRVYPHNLVGMGGEGGGGKHLCEKKQNCPQEGSRERHAEVPERLSSASFLPGLTTLPAPALLQVYGSLKGQEAKTLADTMNCMHVQILHTTHPTCF